MSSLPDKRQKVHEIKPYQFDEKIVRAYVDFLELRHRQDLQVPGWDVYTRHDLLFKPLDGVPTISCEEWRPNAVIALEENGNQLAAVTNRWDDMRYENDLKVIQRLTYSKIKPQSTRRAIAGGVMTALGLIALDYTVSQGEFTKTFGAGIPEYVSHLGEYVSASAVGVLGGAMGLAWDLIHFTDVDRELSTDFQFTSTGELAMKHLETMVLAKGVSDGTLTERDLLVAQGIHASHKISESILEKQQKDKKSLATILAA